MRLSCSKRWCDVVLMALCAAASVWGPTPLGAQGLQQPPEPVLRLVTENPPLPIYPQDIAAIEISESGGITDLFIRLAPDAGQALAELTRATGGGPLRVMACDHILRDTDVQLPNDSATLYLPNTNAVRAEAIRALWHGRRTCQTLLPGALPNGE